MIFSGDCLVIVDDLMTITTTTMTSTRGIEKIRTQIHNDLDHDHDHDYIDFSVFF